MISSWRRLLMGRPSQLAASPSWPATALASLLPVAAPVALLVAFLAAAAPSIVVQDTWMTLVSGREIAEHGFPRSTV
jgi:hypothetical protein